MKQLAGFVFLFFTYALSAQDSLTRYTELIYGHKDGMALTMIHLKPEKKANKKAIIRVISGNWVSNDMRIPSQAKSYDPYLEKGYNVFLVMHGSQPRYALPDQVADIKRAVRFVRYNSEKFGIDPEKIGITGFSSGGNLALIIATADDKTDSLTSDPVNLVSARVKAVAVLFPPTDFFNWGTTGASVVQNEQVLELFKIKGAFDFKTYDRKKVLYVPVTDSAERVAIFKAVSPIYAVTPDDPPVLIMHGTKDFVVPLQQSQIFIGKLKEAKIPHELIIKEGAGHGWKNDEADTEIFIDWFDKYL